LAKSFLSIDDDRHFYIATLAILKTIPKNQKQRCSHEDPSLQPSFSNEAVVVQL
jgi:hypothetical protein